MTPERIGKTAAAAILGCTPRAVVAMAARGDLAAAGAAKLCREWTFDEKRLRAFVRMKEGEACREATARPDERLPPVVIGAVIPFGAGSPSAAGSSADRLKQMMRGLRKAGGPRSKRGS